MRILFLCSCLEPGRDGVGDYVRTLAQSLVSQGHSCALMALHDAYTQVATEEVVQIDGHEILILRLPSALALSETPPIANLFRGRFAPDWISLQLVAYGLNPHGMLFTATSPLRQIVGDVPLHLMLHELWLGNDASPLWKHRIIGFLQRRSLQRFISVLRPRFVATTNPVYAALLKTLGVQADLTSLFSNIPIASFSFPSLLAQAEISPETRNHWWLGIFFGGLYQEWEPEPFFDLLARAAKQAGKRVCLVLAGNAGEAGEAIWSQLSQDYSDAFHFLRLGPQTPETISQLLQAADFGIAASPWSIIAKSGSVAAMLDHGLPVIVTRNDFQPRVKVTLPPSTDPLLFRCDETLQAKIATGLPRRSPHSTVNKVGMELIRRLSGREIASQHKLAS